MSRRRIRTTIGITAALVACALTAGAGGASAAGPAPARVIASSVAATPDRAAIERAPDAKTPKPKASDEPGSAAAAGHSRGWWKHLYSGKGKPKVDAATAQGYLDTVASHSSVFPEQTDASTPAAAHAVLSPTGPDRRARATATLLVAWLQYASGAVTDDSVVPLASGDTSFADLMARAEQVVLDPDATRAELRAVSGDLSRVRQAH